MRLPGLMLLLGLCIGAFSTYQYMDKRQVTADIRQVKKDVTVAIEISADTALSKRTNTVTKTITKWRTRPPVAPPAELTDDEINTICNNHFAPNDIVQSIRSEATRARARFNDVLHDSLP